MPFIAVAYLGSHFLSFLGNGILAVALPLIVLQTTASPLSVGAVSTATAVLMLAIVGCTRPPSVRPCCRTRSGQRAGQ